MTDELDKQIADFLQRWTDWTGQEDYDQANQAIQALIADQMAEYQAQLLKDYKEDIATAVREARIEELELARLWCAGGQGCEYSKLKDRLAQLRSTPNEDMDN